MYLKHAKSGDLVEVIVLSDLFDPFAEEIEGRIHAGEELQDPAKFSKLGLIFPSGEMLPRCWIDPDYLSLRKQA